jgi:iron complex outermembrane receptor protein
MTNSSRLRSSLLIGAAGVAILASAPGLAFAQAKPASSGPAIPEVVVTAEKRSVNIQTVPLAVTAFTAKQRALEGINTIQDLTNFTPGFTYSSQLDRPVMRGLARVTNVYTADSSVGVYDNDLFTNSTFLVGRSDMIVDQVEILLGPQNTLYGRNAVGGVINTQSKRPSEIFGGEIREGFGNYGQNKIEGTVTGPVPFVPNLTFRLSGYLDQQDKGFYKNLAGKDVGGVRHDPYVELQLQYKTDRDTIWLEMYDITFNHDRGGPGSALGTPMTGPYDVGLVPGDGNINFNPNAAYLPSNVVPGSVTGLFLPNNPTTLKNRTIAQNVNEDINVDAAWDFNFHWTHHFDGFDVKYVGGYSQYNYGSFLNNYANATTSINSYQIPTYPLSVAPPQAGNFCGYVNLVAGAGACAPLTVSGIGNYRFDANPRWFSHEINVSSTSSGPLSWIGGLYYYNERNNNAQHFSSPNQPQLTAAGFNVIPYTSAAAPTNYIGTLFAGGKPALAPFNPNQSGDTQFYDYQDLVQTTAVFGQTSYKLTPTLKVTAGLRYSYDHKNLQEETRLIVFDSPALAGLLGQYTPALDVTAAALAGNPANAKGVASPITYPTTGKYAGDAVRKLADSSDAVTGTLALEWTPDRDTLAYARYNRGYKALAFYAGYLGAQPEAAPETVNDYELGLKKTIGRNLQIDIAAFYYDYRNDQVPLTFPLAIPGGGEVDQTEFINIPKAVSDGVEVTAFWTPIEHLNFSLTYSYDHTEIMTGCAQFTTPLTTVVPGCYINSTDPYAAAKGAKPAGPAASGEIYQSVKGDALPQSPLNKFAFNANYTFYFDPGNLTLSGSYIWKDQSFATIFRTTQVNYAPSWSQVDLRATWSGNHDKYEIVAYVKNLFDTIGYDTAAGGYYNNMPYGGGGPTYNQSYDLTPPRLYGAEIHYKF